MRRVFGRLEAWWLLGWAFVLTLFVGRFRRARGLERFRENYAPDRIELFDRNTQGEWQALGGCIACGRCDLGERERRERSNGEYPGLMTLVLSSLRSPRELDAAARAWRHVPAVVLPEKEALCPAQVPFRRLKQLVEARSERS